VKRLKDKNKIKLHKPILNSFCTRGHGVTPWRLQSDIHCCNFDIISSIVGRNFLDSKLYTNSCGSD